MTQTTGLCHESQSSLTVEWYTPTWIFKELDLIFDLDPCQPVGGLSHIPCKQYYTSVDDGLIQPWTGKVWLNPPYGRNLGAWLAKMHSHQNGIALIFARTDCAWFHDYITKSNAILFLRKRVKFIDGSGNTGKSGAGAGSMLVAWGDECTEALVNMKDFGYLAAN